jgi:hypothetical protein
MIRSMTVLVFFVPAIAFADGDPIKAELDKARAKYAEGTNTAKAKFVAAMEAKLKEVAGKGDLDAATQVKSQKELFEKDGTLPKSPHLTRARSDYASEVRVGKEGLRRALEKAKDGYTKALELDKAQALAAELKALAADAKSVVAAPDDLNAKFAEGSVWKGMCKEKRGGAEQTTEVVVTVTKRKGTAFEGTWEVSDGKYVYLFEGTIMKEHVSLKYTKVEKRPKDVVIRNLVGVEHKGSLRLDKAKKPTLVTAYTWRNVNNSGIDAQGTVTLTLVK